MSAVSAKYRLDARLGGGGMAEVFVGSSIGAEGFSRRVAIKRVLPGFSDNEAFAKMFVAEAQISSRLQHPNIVSVLDFDRDPEQRLFLVMELVEGKDLDSLVATGPLPPSVVIFVISEVLRGLGYAHDLPVGAEMRGVIHRDVSPHNVLLSWEGSIKLSDFGIAKARAASEATASVFIKGKPAYMSPEQANGAALDGRSDLFAVGIMLWEMLVGHRLFVGNDTRSTLAAVLFGQIPRPRAQRPDVPADVERVCMKLLERDLPARYATAEEAIAELLDCEAAPRNGRAELSALLAERYPYDAPVRQSTQRAREAAQSTPPPMAASAQALTVPAMPHHARSLGAAMSAPTGTMQPQQVQVAPHDAQTIGRGSGTAKKLALVLAITGVSGLATFAIVSMVKPGAGKTSAPVVSGDAAVVAAVAAVKPPPPAPPPDAAVVAIDAGSGTGTGTSVGSGSGEKEAAVAKPVHVPTGTLSVTHFPIVTVFVDGRNLRDSPVNNYPLPAGHHTLRITNADMHIDQTLPITIEPGKLTREDL